jgi:hypothetical protein
LDRVDGAAAVPRPDDWAEALLGDKHCPPLDLRREGGMRNKIDQRAAFL